MAVAVAEVWGSAISCMSVSLLVSILPYLDYVNIGIYPVLDEISFCFFCLSVFQSLISLPIGHFWGSTSETSGLVGPKHDPYTLPGTAGYWHCFGGSIKSPLRFAWL